MSERDLIRSPVAWLRFIILGAVMVATPALLMMWLIPAPENGNILRSPAEDVRQRDARAEAAAVAAQRRYWLKQIEMGEATFAEAACSVERHGTWNESDNSCL